MCLTCHAQYRDGDAIDQQFCSAVPFIAKNVTEITSGGVKLEAIHLEPSDSKIECRGYLKKVHCLLCMDSGLVDIIGEKQVCPRGCEEPNQ